MFPLPQARYCVSQKDLSLTQQFITGAVSSLSQWDREWRNSIFRLDLSFTLLLGLVIALALQGNHKF